MRASLPLNQDVDLSIPNPELGPLLEHYSEFRDIFIEIELLEVGICIVWISRI